MSYLALVAARLSESGHHTDKIEHGYLPWYERHLPGKPNPKVLVEIGIHEGASLMLWSEWGIDNVVGIDTTPMGTYPPAIPSTRHGATIWELRSSDATVPGVADKACSFCGEPDVIVDDGSHQPDDQCAALALWWPRLRPGGWYVIEDLGVMWAEQWGGHTLEPNATHARVVQMLDAAWRAPNVVAEFHAYEQIAFIRKAS